MGNIPVTIIQSPTPQVIQDPATVVVQGKPTTVIVTGQGVPGRQGPPGNTSLPLAISNPQTGDILTFNASLQIDGAWENRSRAELTDGGFF